MPKISSFLWFDKEAEEAANFYVSIFPNSKIGTIARSPAGGPGPKGGVLTIEFELDGKPFVALNGGPHYKFNEAISLMVECKDQAEVDYYWDKLTAGGQEVQCGWLKDKYGLSWQVTPKMLMELNTDPDPAKVGRVMAAMMQMVKLDIAPLEAAAKG